MMAAYIKKKPSKSKKATKKSKGKGGY